MISCGSVSFSGRTLLHGVQFLSFVFYSMFHLDLPQELLFVVFASGDNSVGCVVARRRYRVFVFLVSSLFSLNWSLGM